jgi:D-serine deaminase-like pyridoxal phosphate-dependent protein
MARVELAAPVTPAMILDPAAIHKSVQLARIQRSHGAAGLTVATVREAELFAADGCSDILVAYPPSGESRIDRLVLVGGELVDARPDAARGWA